MAFISIFHSRKRRALPKYSAQGPQIAKTITEITTWSSAIYVWKNQQGLHESAGLECSAEQ